jgi:hypothetical protein
VSKALSRAMVATKLLVFDLKVVPNGFGPTCQAMRMSREANSGCKDLSECPVPPRMESLGFPRCLMGQVRATTLLKSRVCMLSLHRVVLGCLAGVPLDHRLPLLPLSACRKPTGSRVPHLHVIIQKS